MRIYVNHATIYCRLWQTVRKHQRVHQLIFICSTHLTEREKNNMYKNMSVTFLPINEVRGNMLNVKKRKRIFVNNKIIHAGIAIIMYFIRNRKKTQHKLYIVKRKR